ncbi:MAG: hypothetical protein LAO21_09055 [Acidobacteriia bacterium]|nr:hypothetical protein [Terriglobia bacterium]
MLLSINSRSPRFRSLSTTVILWAVFWGVINGRTFAQNPSDKARRGTPVQNTSGKEVAAEKDLFGFLPKAQRNVALLSYSNILADSVVTRALGLTEVADIVAKRNPGKAVRLFQMAFEMSVDMPEKEYPALKPPPPMSEDSVDEDVFEEWIGQQFVEEGKISKTQIQSRIVRSLAPLDLFQATALLGRIQPPPSFARRFGVVEESSPDRTPRQIVYTDPADFYDAVFTVARLQLKQDPKRALELVTRKIPPNDFAKFQFLPGWIKEVREKGREDGLLQLAEAYGDLKKTQLQPSESVSIASPAIDGLKALIPETAQHYPELIPTMADAILTFSERLRECESRLAEAGTLGPYGTPRMAQHEISAVLLAELQVAIRPADEAVAEHIAELLKKYPPPKKESNEEITRRVMESAPKTFRDFYEAMNQKEYESAYELVNRIEDPSGNFVQHITLARTLQDTHPDVAAKLLDEAEEHLQKIPGGRSSSGKITAYASWRIQFLFLILQVSGTVAPERIPERMQRLFNEFEQVRPDADQPFEPNSKIEKQYLEVLQWLANRRLDDVLAIAKGIKNTRMRVQAFNAVLSGMMSASSGSPAVSP